MLNLRIKKGQLVELLLQLGYTVKEGMGRNSLFFNHSKNSIVALAPMADTTYVPDIVFAAVKRIIKETNVASERKVEEALNNIVSDTSNRYKARNPYREIIKDEQLVANEKDENTYVYKRRAPGIKRKASEEKKYLMETKGAPGRKKKAAPAAKSPKKKSAKKPYKKK